MAIKIKGNEVITDDKYGYLDRLYIGASQNDGYFYSDTSGRTAFTGGQFYIMADTTNTYLYSTNTYLGNTSGDNIYSRGNTISGNSWSITGAGAIIGTTIDVSGKSEANEFKINGTTIINSARNLENLGNTSASLSLSGDILKLTVGGTDQDTQNLQGLTVDQSLKLTTARTITLSGDVSGSTTFDGSANKTISVTVANDSHTHDTRYYTESEVNSLIATATPSKNKTYSFYDRETSGESKTFDLGVHDFCAQAGWTATQDYGSSWHKCRVYPDIDNSGCNGSNYPDHGDTETGVGIQWCMGYGSENSSGGDDSIDCRATCIDWTDV